MPPKAGFWKLFNVVGVVAYCLVAECQQPNVSLGALWEGGVGHLSPYFGCWNPYLVPISSKIWVPFYKLAGP